jgi:hypothetical protein
MCGDLGLSGWKVQREGVHLQKREDLGEQQLN